MDAETARAFLLTLPHVVETQQWGDNLVFWVGDKAIGGKMFCLINLDGQSRAVISYSAGAERFPDLLEQDSFIPAPYMARIHWVAVERWSGMRNAEWQSELRAAHQITLARLPRRIREQIALPAAAREKLIRESRKMLAERKASKPAKPSTRTPMR